MYQWCNEAPGVPATPEGAVIGGRQIVKKMWDNFARLTALLATVRVWFNNSTIYLDFLAIFSEISSSKLIGKHKFSGKHKFLFTAFESNIFYILFSTLKKYSFRA